MKIPGTLIAILTALGLGGGAALASDQPNILLIVADDMGYSDIAPFGGEIATPTDKGLEVSFATGVILNTKNKLENQR
jgi:hypothetical protein